MAVGRAYLIEDELSEDAKILWLPYAVLLGWIVIANLLSVIGLQKIEFTEISQSLPRLNKSPRLRNYKKDTECEFQSTNFNNIQSDNLGASRFFGGQYSNSRYVRMNGNGNVEKWIEEFRIDLEREGLHIPFKQVTLLFEYLSFTR